MELVQKLRVGQEAGLLYTGTRKGVKTWVKVLSEAGVSVAAYHGGHGASSKQEALRQWQSGQRCWMVCTEAFGMGVNKSNVRQPAHHV